MSEYGEGSTNKAVFTIDDVEEEEEKKMTSLEELKEDEETGEILLSKEDFITAGMDKSDALEKELEYRNQQIEYENNLKNSEGVCNKLKKSIILFWKFLYNFESIIRVLIIVIVSATVEYIWTKNTNNLEVGLYRGMGVGIIIGLFLLMIKYLNTRHTGVIDPELNRRVENPVHKYSFLHYLIVMFLFSVWLGILWYIQINCTHKNNTCFKNITDKIDFYYQNNSTRLL